MFVSKLSLVFLCIFVTVAVKALDTSESHFGHAPSDRIVNGKNAARGQFPYQVSLRLADGSHFCSGAILNTRWVITAGLCVVRMAPSMIIIVAAAHRRSEMDGIPYFADRIEVPKRFQLDRLVNDVALIRSTYPFVTVTPLIRPIALPQSDTTAAGVEVTVSGWGYVEVFFDSIHSIAISVYRIVFFLPFVSCHRIRRRSIQDNCSLCKRQP